MGSQRKGKSRRKTEEVDGKGRNEKGRNERALRDTDDSRTGDKRS